MLGKTLEETRVYREAKAEGEQIGEVKGKMATVPLLLKAGLMVEEIAEKLGIGESSSRTFLVRARERMQKLISQQAINVSDGK